MSTFIEIKNPDQGKYPYIFNVGTRIFWLQSDGNSWWKLVEHDAAREYPILGRWSWKKDHQAMVGEALALVLKAVSK